MRIVSGQAKREIEPHAEASEPVFRRGTGKQAAAESKNKPTLQVGVPPKYQQAAPTRTGSKKRIRYIIVFITMISFTTVLDLTTLANSEFARKDGN